jgi:aldehyde:ferredoxin oxidoreductase
VAAVWQQQPNLGLAYAVSPIGPRYDLVEHDLDFDPDEGMPSSFPGMRRLGVAVPRARGVLDVDGTARLMRLWSGLDALAVCRFAATSTGPRSVRRSRHCATVWSLPDRRYCRSLAFAALSHA